MHHKVMYFTRTNNSERVATKIAKDLSVQPIQVTDNQNWTGFLGFLKGGLYASIHKHVIIQYDPLVSGEDRLIVVSPLWAGKLPPAIQALLKLIPKEQVYLVITSNSSTIKNPPPCHSVFNIIKEKDHEDQIIHQLVEHVKKSEK